MATLIRLLAIPFLAMSLNSNVFAEQNELNKGWYGTLGLGVAHQLSSYNELNFDLTKWDFENGANFLLSSGYDFNIFSFEGEFTYRKMDIERRNLVSGGGDIIDDFTGDQTQWSFLLNGFWQSSRELLVSPYLGIGIGATKISWNNVRAANDSSFIDSASFIDDSDFVFTYQVIFGATYALASKFVLKLDYRVIFSDDVELKESGGDLGRLSKQTLDVLLLSLKYKF